MAHLVLVSEAKAKAEAEAEVEVEAEAEWDLEQGPEEQRPLLGGEPSCTRSQLQEFSTNHSLVPDASLPAQVRRRVQSLKHEELKSLFFLKEHPSFLPSFPTGMCPCFPDPGLPAPADLQHRLREAAGVSEAFRTVPPPSPSPEEPLQQRPLLLVPVHQKEDPSVMLEKQRRGLQTNGTGLSFMCPSDQRTCGSVSAADSSSAFCMFAPD